jgi:DNA-binding winged helix-turn-helix (wHTH) protein
MRYEFGELSLDTDALQLRRGEDPLHLSPKAMDLLIILIVDRHRAVPKRELYDRLWQGTFVVDGNLPVLIREIRTALGDTEHEIIRTVYRTGYSFATPVREINVARGVVTAEGFVHILIYDNQQRQLVEGENLVGREPEAQVFLPSASVSRRHALIVVDGGQAIVSDLASKNGTFIGNQPVAQRSVLADGAVIRFGEITVRYRCCAPNSETDSLTSL